MKQTLVLSLQGIRPATFIPNAMFALRHQEQTPAPNVNARSNNPVEYNRIVTIIISIRFSLRSCVRRTPLATSFIADPSSIFIAPLVMKVHLCRNQVQRER